jgi:4-hydroxy-4-methyl-2-oxoglutarate aldolase
LKTTLTEHQRKCLLTISTETIGEVDPRVRIFEGDVRYLSGGKLCGTAFLVKIHPGDNLGAHQAMYEAQEGDVLVIDAGGYINAGFWGEIMTVAALQRGIRGLVTNGAVRDITCYEDHQFPLFSKGVCIRGTTKLHQAKFMTSLIMSGIEIGQGDVLVGDESGMVVFDVNDVDQIIELAEQRDRKESQIMQKLREGERTLDILQL